MNEHIGSTLDEFLKIEGIEIHEDEVKEKIIKKSIAIMTPEEIDELLERNL